MKFNCYVLKKIDKLRCIENYDYDLLNQNVSKTGLKENSIWNRLLDFHVTANFSVNCFHDILEGVCHYDLISILKNLFQQKVLCLSDLNRRIEIFNFGVHSINKPPLFNKDFLEKNKIRVSGSEMFVLIVYLPMIIGDLVSNRSNEWKLLIALREIISIVFRKHHHKDSLQYLRYAISNHNNLYKKVSGSYLKPKFHFLVHYASVMEKIGPVSAISSIRFESKHQTLKKSIYISNNRTNILQTVVIKNQMKFADLILNYDEHFGSLVSFAPLKISNSNLISKYHFVSNDDFRETDFLQFYDNLFKRGMILCIDFYEDGDPLFAVIDNILVHDNKFFFCVELTETLYFDKHYFAFRIEKTGQYCTRSIESLKCKYTSHINTNASGEFFVIWDY